MPPTRGQTAYKGHARLSAAAIGTIRRLLEVGRSLATAHRALLSPPSGLDVVRKRCHVAMELRPHISGVMQFEFVMAGDAHGCQIHVTVIAQVAIDMVDNMRFCLGRRLAAGDAGISIAFANPGFDFVNGITRQGGLLPVFGMAVARPLRMRFKFGLARLLATLRAPLAFSVGLCYFVRSGFRGKPHFFDGFWRVWLARRMAVEVFGPSAAITPRFDGLTTAARAQWRGWAFFLEWRNAASVLMTVDIGGPSVLGATPCGDFPATTSAQRRITFRLTADRRHDFVLC